VAPYRLHGLGYTHGKNIVYSRQHTFWNVLRVYKMYFRMSVFSSRSPTRLRT
jgi:hypothetical protein